CVAPGGGSVAAVALGILRVPLGSFGSFGVDRGGPGGRGGWWCRVYHPPLVPRGSRQARHDAAPPPAPPAVDSPWVSATRAGTRGARHHHRPLRRRLASRIVRP